MDASPASTEPRRARWLLAVTLTLAALALYLPAIGVGDFVGDDEALDAGVVVEMERSGDWLFPEFNGEYLPPKPPLFYWSARAVSVLRGTVDEASLRIPSAVAGATLVGLTAYALAPTEGALTAGLAGLMLLTMPIMRDQARVGRCDMMLALLVTACLFIARLGWDSAPRRLGFAALLGLAAITKGGAGVGIVVASLVAAAVAERSVRPLGVFLSPAMAAFVILGGSWYLIGALHWGERFVDEQIIGENLNHLIGGTALSDRDPGTRSLAYHLPYYAQNLFVTMLPWSLCLPLVVVELWRRRPLDEQHRFLVAWIVGGLVLLTAAARKSPYYLLPLAPAVSALVAGWLAPKIRQSAAARRFRLRPAVLVFAPVAAIGVWLVARGVPGAGCGSQAVIDVIHDQPLATIGAISLLAVAIAAAALALRDRDWAAGSIATLCALASLWLFVDHVEGRVADCGSLRPFGRALAEATPSDTPLFFFQDPLPAVALYSGRRIATLRDPAERPTGSPFYLVVPESLRPRVPQAWLAASQVVASGHGRVFTRRAMGIELLAIPAGAPS